MIDKPGIYSIGEAEYHADPCQEISLSSSIAKLLINRTPRHAWEAHPRLNPDWTPDNDEVFDIGSAAHSLFLRDVKPFVVVDSDNWRTKEARQARDDARANGKIPLLVGQWLRVNAMVAAARVQLADHYEAKGAFTKGKPEQTLIWQEGDIWCRARLDWLPVGSIFDDYKTTECADPDVFLRQVLNIGHDIQAAFYCRGIRKLGLCATPTFQFIVQERDPPYQLSVCALAPDFIDLADHKVARAIEIWRACLAANKWPGYPKRTCWLETPPWHEAQFMARDERTLDTERELREAAKAQAPL